MRILGLVLVATACTSATKRPRSPHVEAPQQNTMVEPRGPGDVPPPTDCHLTTPSPTPELTWMKQPVADWLRARNPAEVPPYCSGPGIPTTPQDPAFDAWFSIAMRTLARLPCEELDARLITFRGANFGTGARFLRRELPPTGSARDRCFPSEGPSLTLGVDAAGAITCVMPAIEDGPSAICLD